MTKLQTKAECIKRKTDGEPCKELAEEYGVSVRTINNWKNDEKVSNLLSKYGFQESDVTGGWIKGDDFSLRVKKEVSEVDISEVILNSLQKVVPSNIPTVSDSSKEGDDLMVLSMADLHIGKRDLEGKTNNLNRLLTAAITAIKTVVDTSKSKDALLILGNDVIHTDGRASTTTRGTPQDTGLSWDEMMEQAIILYSSVIEYLLNNGVRVQCIHTMSNHDYHLGYAVSLALKHKYPQCCWQVDTSPIKFIQWGDNLIASTHGDQFKINKVEGLIPLMARKAGLHEYKHCFCFSGHFHHRVQKDFVGVTLKGLRSTSPTDQWHLESGYVGAPKSFEFFTFHKTKGETAQYTFTI